MTKDELKQMIDNIDMVQFAQSIGYDQEDKDKSTQLWTVLKKSNDEKIIISRNIPNKAKSVNPPSDHYRNAINLYIDTINGHYNEIFKPSSQQYKEAIKYVQDFSNTIQTETLKTYQKSSYKREYNEADLLEKYNYRPINLNNNEHTKYLFKRGINLETLEFFKNDIVITDEDIKHYQIQNTAFLKRNQNDEIVGIVKRFFNQKNESKQIENGINGFWHSQIKEKQRYKGIVICENQIDALSYFQLKKESGETPEDYIYTTIDGTINESKVKNTLDYLPKKIMACSATKKPLNIQLAFDNDKMGHYYALKCIVHESKNQFTATITNNKRGQCLTIDDKAVNITGLEKYQNILKRLIKHYGVQHLHLDFPQSNDFNEDLKQTQIKPRSRSL